MDKLRAHGSRRPICVMAAAAAVLLVHVTCLCLPLRARDIPRQITLGNTPSNIANSGLAAFDDGWVYYADSVQDQKDPFNLCKSRPDGSEKTILVRGISPLYINVADGWVFFSGNGEQAYKVKTDGSELTALDSPFEFRHHAFADHVLIGSGTDRSVDRAILLSLDPATGQSSPILFKKSEEAPRRIVVSSEGWVYYFRPFGGPLRRVRMDGTGDSRVIQSKVWQYVVGDGSVYYCLQGEGVWRARADGRRKRRILPFSPFCLNVSNGTLYYSNYGIWAMPVDGPAPGRKIMDRQQGYDARLISVVGDWIYFERFDWKRFRVKIDGTGLQELL